MAGKGKRGFESARDMVLSMGLVLGVVVLILVISFRDEPESTLTVDPAPVVQAIPSSAPFPAVAPLGLDQEWRPTSARLTAPEEPFFAWHIGYVTPSDEYGAVGQSDAPRETYLEQERAAGEEVGELTIAGQEWTQVEREDGQRRSLVAERDGVVTLVTGTATYDELSILVESLIPAEDAAAKVEPAPPRPVLAG